MRAVRARRLSENDMMKIRVIIGRNPPEQDLKWIGASLRLLFLEQAKASPELTATRHC
jgi:hypothetical protein